MAENVERDLAPLPHEPDHDPLDVDVDPDSIEVHWQHPRTELEAPLLLVWPHPVRDEWAATVDNGVATVVCHEWLVEVDSDDPDEDTEVQKRAQEWGADEEIPTCVAEALLDYDDSMNYGPVHTVTNPYEEREEEDDRPKRDENQRSVEEASHVE